MDLFKVAHFRARLVVLVLMAVLPSAAVLLYTGVRDREATRENTLQDYRQTAKAVADRQAGVLSGVHRLLLTLGKFPAVRATSPAACDKLLPQILEEHGDYLNLVVLDPDGSPFCSARPFVADSLRHGSVATSTWFQRSMQTRATVAGDYGSSVTRPEPNIVVALPILSGPGAPSRILAAVVSLDSWRAIVASVHAPVWTSLTLVDRQRTIVARTPEGARWIGQRVPGLAPGPRPAADMQDFVDAKGVDGIRRFFVTAPLMTGFETGLSVAIGAAYKDALNASDRLWRQQLTLFSLIALATIVVAAFASEWFVLRPVTTLQGVTARLAGGDLTARAQLVGGVPGLPELGEAINAMAVALEARQHDRENAERAVRDAHERMQLAVEASHAGIWDVDLKADRVRFSSALEAQHGLAPGTFGGTFAAFLNCVEPADRATVRRILDQATQTRTDANILYRTRWPDGSVHWLSGMGRVFCDAAGVPVRAAGVSFDVTQVHAQQEQHRRVQRIGVAGDLSSAVTHDQNLLTALLGHADRLSTLVDVNDVSSADLAAIRQVGGSAARLIRQLSVLSSTPIMEPRAWPLSAIVNELQPTIRRLLPDDIALSVRLGPDVGLVQVDRRQLEQVILNLIVNAHDAMPGGGELTIVAYNVDIDGATARAWNTAAGSYATLVVGDTGHGMSREVLSRVFEPFFTTKARGQGTGLGLATVYNIVKQHRGHVTANSEPDRGSSFAVYVPRPHAADGVALPDDDAAAVDRRAGNWQDYH
jgi:signal transduction histidine kinase